MFWIKCQSSASTLIVGCGTNNMHSKTKRGRHRNNWYSARPNTTASTRPTRSYAPVDRLSLTHPLTHSLTHTHSHTHSPTHSLTHSTDLDRPLARQVVRKMFLGCWPSHSPVRTGLKANLNKINGGSRCFWFDTEPRPCAQRHSGKFCTGILCSAVTLFVQ